MYEYVRACVRTSRFVQRNCGQSCSEKNLVPNSKQIERSFNCSTSSIVVTLYHELNSIVVTEITWQDDISGIHWINSLQKNAALYLHIRTFSRAKFRITFPLPRFVWNVKIKIFNDNFLCQFFWPSYVCLPWAAPCYHLQSYSVSSLIFFSNGHWFFLSDIKG